MRVLEFDNIISSNPASNPGYLPIASVETVEYNLCCRILGPQKLQSISANHLKHFGVFRCYAQVQDAF